MVCAATSASAAANTAIAAAIAAIQLQALPPLPPFPVPLQLPPPQQATLLQLLILLILLQLPLRLLLYPRHLLQSHVCTLAVPSPLHLCEPHAFTVAPTSTHPTTPTPLLLHPFRRPCSPAVQLHSHQAQVFEILVASCPNLAAQAASLYLISPWTCRVWITCLGLPPSPWVAVLACGWQSVT